MLHIAATQTVPVVIQGNSPSPSPHQIRNIVFSQGYDQSALAVITDSELLGITYI